MEPVFQAHPIPQNVTNFEFHLIGDMTIKQFGYLALGLGIAFLTFIGLAQHFPFIAWPIIIISSGIGAAFAFIPIQERPLDHWVMAFFKAIFQPTKLVYESKILKKEDPYFSKRLAFYLKNKHTGTHSLTKLSANPMLSTPASTIIPASTPTPPQRRPSMADKLLAQQQNIPTVPSAMPVSSPQTPTATTPPITNVTNTSLEPKKEPNLSDLKKTVDLAKEAQETQGKIIKIEKQLEQIKTTVAQPGADAKFYADQFQSLLTDLQKLNEHASATAHDLAILANTTVTPANINIATPPPPQVNVVPKKVTGVKLTSFPNVINGIVTDSQGNYIEGAVIVVHDKQGLPVRALRSNKLGQFVAATPLSDGTYMIAAEKDNLLFDQIAVELRNEIPEPILISAKKQLPTATS